MCGITGILYKDQQRMVDQEILQRANNTLTHRGPDDAGFWVEGHVGIAMRRLSIIDVAGGHQPIANETNQIQIVYNGELYNYAALRDSLMQKGHRFKTLSDTESILHAYEEFGSNLFQQLNGMFAFAIWDAGRQSLLIARDRMGIKPLFYYEDDEKLIFASEIKAILAFPGVRLTFNQEAFFDYLTLNYIPAPGTIYTQIHKLMPGHYLRWCNNSLQCQRYWDFAYSDNPGLSLTAASDRLEELLTDAIKIRLMSEVPLGAFLSGGIDSSTIAYFICQRQLKETLHTFSIGFKTRSVYNELPFSALVARQLGTIHHTEVVDPGMIELLPRVVELFDEPMSDPSAIPTYLLSRFTRQFVTVALSGDGGDELFAGYERQKVINILQRFYRLPKRWQRFLMTILMQIHPTEQKDSLWSSVKRVMADIAQGHQATYHRWVTNCNATFLSNLLPEDLFHDYSRYSTYKIIDDCFAMTSDPINQSLNFETRYYLPDDLLVKVDRMSMGHSLEVRVPFIDFRLVEFAASLPVHFKIRSGKTKFLLKHLMRKYLPHEIIRKPKQGFSPPIKEWLRRDLREFTCDLLRSDYLASHFNVNGIRAMLESHYGSRRDFQYQIWSLLVFSVWYRNIKQNPLI